MFSTNLFGTDLIKKKNSKRPDAISNTPNTHTTIDFTICTVFNSFLNSDLRDNSIVFPSTDLFDSAPPSPIPLGEASRSKPGTLATVSTNGGTTVLEVTFGSLSCEIGEGTTLHLGESLF